MILPVTLIPLCETISDPVITAEPLYGNPAPDVFSAYEAVNAYDEDIELLETLTYDAVYANKATSAKR